MADLAATSVTINRSFYAGGLQNKDYVTKNVTMTLVSQGIANSGSQIPASAFGLSRIESCSNFCNAAGTKIYTAVPVADGSCLLLDDPGTTPGTPTAITDSAVTGSVTGPPLATY